MKRIILVFLMFLVAVPVVAAGYGDKFEAMVGGVETQSPRVLSGKLEYTVESARREAFEGVLYEIPVSTFSRYLTDPNYAANKRAIANKQRELGDRLIEWYSDGSYLIVYKNDRRKEYSYKSDGKLDEIGIRSDLSYPLKSTYYGSSGKLSRVSFYLSGEDIYIYTSEGVLKSHWVGDNCYDINGKIILKRIK